MVDESAESRPAHILIVDDDPASGGAIEALASSFGHATTLVHAWTEAVRIFDSATTDLVLMDAVMPGVDGFKLTQILRSRSDQYVPIVFVTGLNDSRAKQHGVDAGADDFLCKPVDKFELSMRLTAMLRIRKLTAALEDKSRALERLATTDALTGLENRRRFDERIRSECARSHRYRTDLSLLMLDIDHFKAINDTFGHDVGDEVLSILGKTILDIIRKPDIAFRYGGEEFAILAPETTSHQGFFLGERLRKEFDRRTTECSAGVQTLSIGISGANCVGSEVSESELFKAADTALYRAKSSGRDRTCLHGEPDDYSLQDALERADIPSSSFAADQPPRKQAAT